MQKIKAVLSHNSDDSKHGSSVASGSDVTHEGVIGDHKIGHDRSPNLSNNFDLKSATHEHKHLAEKTHEHHLKHQTEEVTRETEHERHVHHVQHHVQPVLDEKHHETKHTTNVIPQTHITEKHGSTKEDIAAFHGLAKHKDEVHDHGVVERNVVDKGEKVNEHVHHHVTNVVQPIVKTDHHHHEVIHTVIPTKRVTHEAPTVHESLEHAPISKDQFIKSGGALGSGVTHHEAGLLNEGGCDREVQGVGEKIAAKLGLGNSSTSSHAATNTKI